MRPDQQLTELCQRAIQEAKDNGVTHAELSTLAHRAMEGDAEARQRYLEAVSKAHSGAHSTLYATATPEFILAALAAAREGAP